jgi:hypothetical protein
VQHQVRGGFGSILGWDLGTGLSLASALGMNTFVVADLLPAIEAVAIRKINEQLEASRNE